MFVVDFVLLFMVMDAFFIVNYVLCMGTSMKWYLNKCRVTCRDWFQLSLKEGLTVFRDQVQISSFQYSKWQLYNHNSNLLFYLWKCFNIARSFHLTWGAALLRGLLMFQGFEFLSFLRLFLVPFHDFRSEVKFESTRCFNYLHIL